VAADIDNRWRKLGRAVSANVSLRPEPAQSGPNGFAFPYGDYFGLSLNGCGSPMLTWGEGLNWAGGASNPGHVEFRTLC